MTSPETAQAIIGVGETGYLGMFPYWLSYAQRTLRGYIVRHQIDKRQRCMMTAAPIVTTDRNIRLGFSLRPPTVVPCGEEVACAAVAMHDMQKCFGEDDDMAERKQFITSISPDPELLALLEQNRKREITEEELREQRISFAYGNAPDSDLITKDSVRAASGHIRLL